MQVYLKQLPTILPKLSSFSLPLIPSIVQTKSLSIVVNHVMKDLLLDGEFDFLVQRFLEIKVKDLEKSWFFTCDNNKAIVCHSELDFDIEPDVVISGNLNDFALLCGQGVDPDTLFFKRQLSITGDTDLGLAIKNSLDEIEFTRLPKPIRLALNHYISLIKLS